jgi:hypothetical protein
MKQRFCVALARMVSQLVFIEVPLHPKKDTKTMQLLKNIFSRFLYGPVAYLVKVISNCKLDLSQSSS